MNTGQAKFSLSTTVVNEMLSYGVHLSYGLVETETGLLTFVLRCDVGQVHIAFLLVVLSRVGCAIHL